MAERKWVVAKLLLALSTIIAGSVFVILVATEQTANGAVSSSKHDRPSWGGAGVTRLCGPTSAYTCTSGGYAGSGPGWVGPEFGGQWASVDAQGRRHNCTLYAGFKIYQNGVTTYPGRLGNAMDWAQNAAGHGIIVDQSPAVGAIAQWNQNKKKSASDVGHVAYVEEVTSSYIVISDDAYGENATHKYRIDRTSSAMPDNFIHFKDVAAPPVSGPSQYLGSIVHWDKEGKTQKTSWLVVTVNGAVRRQWIPDISTYWCLKGKGAPGPLELSSTVLDSMPDMWGVHATCNTRGGQGGGDGGSGFGEQAGHNGARTFADPHTASGEGPRVSPGQFVSVACKVLDGNVGSSNPDGYWYQLVGDPWQGNYWAPANVFMNGDPWNGPYTHNTDFSVPDCGKDPGAGGGGGGGTIPVGSRLEQQGRHGVNTFSNYHSASGAGPRVEAGQYVHVECKVLDGTIASSNPDGYWYRISSSPWNGAYYAPANTFMNGDPWNGPYTHNTDFNVPDCATSTNPTPPPPGTTTYAETQGRHGVNTFSNYHNASGQGPSIAAGAVVQVTCKVLDGTIASVNPDGYWYKIASSPWNNSYYAPANTFMNGDPPSGPYTHNTDFAVPTCGSAPPPPPTTWQEQQGSRGVNTFTNYHNASGMGPRIAAGAWVTVSCKVYDPTIASTNPDGYWYRIATSPWNNAYYAPANTFMNGDPWGGPYTHNTDFNVANC